KGVFHGSFHGRRGLSMGFQAAEYLSGLACHQSGLLLPQPTCCLFRTRDLEPGATQVFTDMVKVDQVLALRAKVLLKLFHDPRRSVADPVHKSLWIQPAVASRLSPEQGHAFQSLVSRYYILSGSNFWKSASPTFCSKFATAVASNSSRAICSKIFTLTICKISFKFFWILNRFFAIATIR